METSRINIAAEHHQINRAIHPPQPERISSGT